MGQLSDDGQWWWDGANWVATAQVVLPQLPPTEFEASAQLADARRRAKKGGRVWEWTDTIYPLAAFRLVALGDLLPALSVYRSWKLAQMALNAGCNDFMGTLINESISTSAGAIYGQRMAPREMRAPFPGA